MTFPLWYLLVPYAFVVLSTGIFAFFNMYHVAKFGLQAVSTTFLLGVYTVAYAVVLIASLIVMNGYNWTAAASISDIFPFLGGVSAGFGL